MTVNDTSLFFHKHFFCAFIDFDFDSMCKFGRTLRRPSRWSNVKTGSVTKCLMRSKGVYRDSNRSAFFCKKTQQLYFGRISNIHIYFVYSIYDTGTFSYCNQTIQFKYQFIEIIITFVYKQSFSIILNRLIRIMNNF